jgi:hypothetical protein
VNRAFNGWIYFEPQFVAGQGFFDRVHNATRSDFPTLFDESVLPHPYAAAMYDAIILVATVANQQRWLPEQGGRAFLNQSIGNLSFEGATGSVKLDAHGDSVLSYQAINLVLTNGELQRNIAGVFGAGTRSYSSSDVPIIWPGGLLSVPADVSVASVSDGFDTKWVLVGAGASAVIVVGGVVIVVRKRHAHLQAIMALLFTEVSFRIDDAEPLTVLFIGPEADTGMIPHTKFALIVGVLVQVGQERVALRILWTG